MLVPTHIISVIADCADWADNQAREDLINGVIVTENDYTSNFTSSLRREINRRKISGLTAHVQVLSPKVERKAGADGCIIFKSRTHFKIGIFEAKWPRLSMCSNSWDFLQKGKSHFDQQLSKQSKLTNCAVWEMFYSEEPYGQNPTFPPFGSSCVWHDDALVASAARNHAMPWNDAELRALLANNFQSVGSIVTTICECIKGKELPINVLSNWLSDLRIGGQATIVKFNGPVDQRDV